MDRSRILDNGNAFTTTASGNAGNVARIRVGRSSIEGNFCAFTGQVFSYGDNAAEDNGSDPASCNTVSLINRI